MSLEPWKLRLAALIVVGGYLLLNPAFVQIRSLRPLAEGFRPALHPWQMYAGYGRDSCDLLVNAQVDGEWQEVDHIAVLRSKPWHELTLSQRRTYKKDLNRVGRDVCRKLGATDVRIRASCGSNSGWRRRKSGKNNLCANARQR